MSLDIFNPSVSSIAHGLEGKTILVYGGNNLGKTKQATRMKKPYHLSFEKGLGAIAGVPFAPINNWADFKKINRQLTAPQTVAKAKQVYQTIIFDEVEAAARYCQRYVCNKYGADTIASGNSGYGLWKEYEIEVWEELNKLIGAGYTLVFIAHQESDKNGKIRPKGDKRTLDPIVDNSDVVVHVRSNGVDEKGKVIKSSGYVAETDEYFARSRFDYIDTVIPEFTAETLEAVLIEAIKRQEEVEGIKAVTYTEQKATQVSEELDFDELKREIIALGKQLQSKGKGALVTEKIEEHFGKDKKVADFKKDHVEVMSIILLDLKDAVAELEE